MKEENLQDKRIHGLAKKKPCSFWISPAALFLGAACIFFWKCTFLGQALCSEDITGVLFSLRTFYRECLSHGVFPLWNPYQSCGMPFAANPETAAFYPFTLIFYLLPVERAMAWYTVLHFFMASFFMFLYLQFHRLDRFASILGAFLFSYSGYMVTHAAQFNMLGTSVWLPLLLLFWEKYCRERRTVFVIYAGLVLGIQFMAGFPQVALYNLLGFCLFLLFYMARAIVSRAGGGEILRLFTAFSIVLILGFSLSAVQLLPTSGLLRFNQRSSLPFDPDFANSMSMKLSQMPYFFFPELYTFKEHISLLPRNPGWDTEEYLGAVPFLLLLFSLAHRKKYHYFLWATCLFTLLVSLGREGGINSLLLHIFPFYQKFRCPVRIVFLFSLASSMLGAWGANALMERCKTLSRLRPMRAWKTLLLLLVLLDQFSLGINYNRTVHPDYYKEPEIFKKIKQDRGYYRVLTTFSVPFFYLNAGIAYEVSNLVSYTAFALNYYFDYIFYNEYGRLPDSSERIFFASKSNMLPIKKYHTQAIRLLNLKYVLSSSRDRIYATVDLRCLPRFFMVYSYQVPSGIQETLMSLASPGFCPEKQVLLEKDPEMRPSQPEVEPVILVKNYGVNEINLEVKTATPGILVASEIYYPGWKAYVDGERGEILRANHVLRAISLSPGSHSIRMIFEPADFRIGLAVTLASTIIVIATLVYLATTGRRKAATFRNGGLCE